MRLFPFALLIAVGACAQAPEIASVSGAVVFGEDDRLEPYQVEDTRLQTIARTQVAVRIVDWAVDLDDPDRPRITYERTLGRSENLCEGERFTDQIAPGSCSATLIDPQHILTAAHCLEPDECDGGHYWVFGFEMQEDGERAPLSPDDVYGCNGIVVANNAADYAIIELDRPAVGREPVESRIIPGGLPLNAAVHQISFPSGIPVKVDSGGVVTSSVSGGTFATTVDAFSSSSGSGTFDENGRLVGFLQRGEVDYVPNGECNIVNVIESPRPGTGELSAYLNLAFNAFCETGADSPICAYEGAPCAEVEQPDAGTDAGMDAGSDAAPDAVDAGAMDAGSLDAGAMDGGLPGTPVESGGCGVAPGTPNRSPWALLAFLIVIYRRTDRAHS